MWQPLLAGEARMNAIRVASHIAEELMEWVGRLEDDTLSSGSAGLAVLFHYYAKSVPGTGCRGLVRELLGRGMSALEAKPMPPALHGGFVGILWAMAHLGDYWISDGDGNGGGNALADIDLALLESLKRSPWSGDFDLVNGLAGIGSYALERLPDPTAAAMLEAIVDRLEEMSEVSPLGAAWYSGPELMRGTALLESPRGCYNFGLAHGIPGVVGVLGAALRAGIAARKAGRLLEGAVGWLLAHRLPPSHASRYLRCIGPGVEPTPARTGWCYGDPGVAAAIEVAAHGAGRPDWSAEAAAIGRTAAGRTRAESGVVDGCFCHGASGVAHMFNRLGQSTRDPALAAAARDWLARLLEMARDGEGIGGYASRTADENGRPGWEANPGMLDGAAGVALTLLAAATEVEPEWDRMFMLSARNPSRSDDAG